MVSWECPYGSDLMWVKINVPIKMNGIDEIWMNWSERGEMKWNEWIEGSELEQPYGNGPMVGWRCPYQSDLVEPYENVPIKMNGFNEKLVNWVKWGEMSDLKELIWNNPMGISLWSSEGVPIKVTWVNLMGISLWVENECPYQFDLIDLSEKVPMFSWMNVPIKVT